MSIPRHSARRRPDPALKIRAGMAESPPPLAGVQTGRFAGGQGCEPARTGTGGQGEAHLWKQMISAQRSPAPVSASVCRTGPMRGPAHSRRAIVFRQPGQSIALLGLTVTAPAGAPRPETPRPPARLPSSVQDDTSSARAAATTNCATTILAPAASNSISSLSPSISITVP